MGVEHRARVVGHHRAHGGDDCLIVGGRQRAFARRTTPPHLREHAGRAADGILGEINFIAFPPMKIHVGIKHHFARGTDAKVFPRIAECGLRLFQRRHLDFQPDRPAGAGLEGTRRFARFAPCLVTKHEGGGILGTHIQEIAGIGPARYDQRLGAADRRRIEHQVDHERARQRRHVLAEAKSRDREHHHQRRDG